MGRLGGHRAARQHEASGGVRGDWEKGGMGGRGRSRSGERAARRSASVHKNLIEILTQGGEQGWDSRLSWEVVCLRLFGFRFLPRIFRVISGAEGAGKFLEVFLKTFAIF